MVSPGWVKSVRILKTILTELMGNGSRIKSNRGCLTQISLSLYYYFITQHCKFTDVDWVTLESHCETWGFHLASASRGHQNRRREMGRLDFCAGSGLTVTACLDLAAVKDCRKNKTRDWKERKPNLEPKELQEDLAVGCLILSLWGFGGQDLWDSSQVNDFMWKRRAPPYQNTEEERLLKVKKFYLWKQHKHKVRKMASERSI